MCSSRIFFIFTFSLVLVSIEASDPDSSTNADTKKYNPLYVVFENYKYSLVDSIKYNSVLKNHNYETSEDKVKMLAACPKKDTPIDEALLEIMPVDEKTLDVDGYKCDSPGTFFTKQKTHGEHIVIGFMIYDKNNHSGHIGILPGTPWNHFPIPLIKIAYKQFVNRSITSWHEINFSDILPLDEDPDQQLLNNSVYEKDVEFYGYDIDPAYKEKNQSRFVREFFKKESQSRLVKLQLAPSADFYFDEWKSATRSNIKYYQLTILATLLKNDV
ncbi:uncharacterized protein LOC135848532 [Planococcus citri]|uniref:uncharacterized protein LOC135848532 n=1 Tax=Planococcus citri TaxID=170843 RepID=UPI0031F82458